MSWSSLAASVAKTCSFAPGSGWLVGPPALKPVLLPALGPCPFTLKGVTLRNRIAMSPMTMYRAVDGKMSDYHVMLMGLKQQLKAGDMVPLTLTVEGKDGKKETVELKLPVKALGAN